MKMTSLSNSWKLMLDEDPDQAFTVYEVNDFRQTPLRVGEREVSVEDVEKRLEEKNSDPGYQVVYTEEIS